MSQAKKFITQLLSEADIEVNGGRPFDIQVSDEKFFARILKKGSLGVGESYMDGDWDCAALDECVAKFFQAGLEKKVGTWRALPLLLSAMLINAGSPSRAFRIGERHYDIGNDLYSAMLGKYFAYTCGYWKDAANLDEAQEAKLDLVCRKIGLKFGMTVLDIGCGWGSFCKFAAERYGATVTGITVSKEQVALARERCAGLPIEIRLEDYRDTRGTFDRVISLGMFEHVGYKNYRTYMEAVERLLKDDGIFLLHTIGGNTSVRNTDPWIDKYIFPGSMLPSVSQIARAAEGIFVMEDWHNFGADYDKTLLAWFRNFDAAWPKLQEKYGERFYRMWKFYLLSCAGSFRTRKNQLWQIVFSKNGVNGGYESVR